MLLISVFFSVISTGDLLDDKEEEMKQLLEKHDLTHIWSIFSQHRFDDLSLWLDIDEQNWRDMDLLSSDRIRFKKLQLDLNKQKQTNVEKLPKATSPIITFCSQNVEWFAAAISILSALCAAILWLHNTLSIHPLKSINIQKIIKPVIGDSLYYHKFEQHTINKRRKKRVQYKSNNNTSEKKSQESVVSDKTMSESNEKIEEIVQFNQFLVNPPKAWLCILPDIDNKHDIDVAHGIYNAPGHDIDVSYTDIDAEREREEKNPFAVHNEARKAKRRQWAKSKKKKNPNKQSIVKWDFQTKYQRNIY